MSSTGPLSDFFFVYNEHRDEHSGLLQDRSLIAKMTYMVARAPKSQKRLLGFGVWNLGFGRQTVAGALRSTSRRPDLSASLRRTAQS